MIKLTDETKRNKNDELIDDSLYLDRLDANNLVLKRGDKVLNYFGDVRVALIRSLNYAIKGSNTELSLKKILETVQSMDNVIKELKDDAINHGKRI